MGLMSALDEYTEALVMVRMIETGDPPPSPPPIEGYVWNGYMGFWEESDTMLRARHMAAGSWD